MKRLHKAAAVLFAAAILCSFSVFAYAAEDDRGDEWETEEISAAEVQESSQQSSKPEESSRPQETSTSSVSDTASKPSDSPNPDTGDYTVSMLLLCLNVAGVCGIFAATGSKIRRKGKK